MGTGSALGLALLAAIPVLAQSSSAPAEIASHDNAPTFQSGVNLVTVPVVVRDSRGNAIGNLTKDDFELFDKGKRQAISKFSIEQPGTTAEAIHEEPRGEGGAAEAKPAGPVASNFAAYLFDDLHSDSAAIARARTAMEKHLANLPETARAALFTTSGLVAADFTSERAKLTEALNRVVPRSRAGTRQTECPFVPYFVADRIVMVNDTMALDEVTAEAAAQCNSQTPRQDAQMAARRAFDVGEMEVREAMGTLRGVVRRVAAMPGSRTVVVVSPGFLTLHDHPELTAIIDEAARRRVTISGLDPNGLVVVGAAGDASRRFADSPALHRYESEAYMVEGDTLAELAEGTGGQYFHNDNGLYEGFQLLASPPAFVYLLGFAPENLKSDGKYHVLKVKLARSSDLRLQARRGYFAPKPGADAGDQEKADLQEAVFSREEMNDIPMSFHAQFFKTGETAATLSVLAKLDVRRIHYQKEAGRNSDDLVLVSALFDRDGNLIKALEKRVELRLRDATLQSGLSHGITVKTDFDVTSGSYVIRLVARDTQGRMISAANGAIEIP